MFQKSTRETLPEHACHVAGCQTKTPPRLLMCPQHWKKVPRSLQEAVTRTYNARSKERDETWLPWLAAARAAIDSLTRVKCAGCGKIEQVDVPLDTDEDATFCTDCWDANDYDYKSADD